jgi:serine/threonine-protein kinase
MAELKSLGRYTLGRVLGKGAMGVVYEGVDPRLNRRVAIKTILRSHLDEATAKSFAARFVQEAQAVARLNHPNIVQVHDFGEEGDLAYLVMEFIRGKELKAFFDANERFELKETVRIMGELCEALEFAHRAGVVHRDVKPGNVMLDAEARTKLTDFGVARVQDVNRTHATLEGTMVGTPAYMSPEQIAGRQVDRRTDVFSAGIILYQFLTGELPFSGGGAWTVAKKIMQDDPPLPSSINTVLTSPFDAVVCKALAKDPDQRFQSAKDLGIALKRALEGKPFEDESEKTVVAGAAAALKPARTVRAGAQAGSQDAEVEFWRSIKDGSDAADFELYVEEFPSGTYAKLARRKIAKLRGLAPEETELRPREQEEQEKREAAGPAKPAPVLPMVIAGLVVAAIAGGAWIATRPDTAGESKRMAELVAQLEEGKKREADLKLSKEREAQLLREAELARQREADAKRSADLARQREAEALQQAEQKKQASVVKKREAELARLQADAAKQRDAEQARQAAVRAAAEKAKAEQAGPAPAASVPSPARQAAPEGPQRGMQEVVARLNAILSGMANKPANQKKSATGPVYGEMVAADADGLRYRTWQCQSSLIRGCVRQPLEGGAVKFSSMKVELKTEERCSSGPGALLLGKRCLPEQVLVVSGEGAFNEGGWDVVARGIDSASTAVAQELFDLLKKSTQR